jgi:transitional endoplasmic reticulum ATPase
MNNRTIDTLREALVLSPDNIPLRLHLAELLQEELQFTEAAAEYKQVLSFESRNRKALMGLARCYYSLNDLSLAIVILEDFIQKNPNDADASLLYCRVLVKEKSYAEAAEVYRRLLEAYPDYQDGELDGILRVNALQADTHAEFFTEEEMEEELDDFLQKPTINFDDVGGMNRVKEEIDLKIIKPLEFQDIYKAYGKKTGGGILLYGPPGCGKTHIARATAGQVNAKFISIGINDVLDMWIGGSEKNLHELFDLARRNTPCVLFFDEVDALGANRRDMRQSAGRHLINQFLAEMDGIDANNDGLLIMGATNAPWHLDPAFRRPGRFDRIIFVEPPDEEGRIAILQILLKEKPKGDIDYRSIAKHTAEFSGADLKAVVDLAIESKLAEAFKTGIPAPLQTKDLVNAAKQQHATTKEWFSTARSYALYSNESGLYDDILTYLKIKK